ncbi:MAG: ATP-binding protein [Nitrospirota bacterium]
MTRDTELQESKKESKDDLIHAEKLAFTGRIAASIAHEVRNPLANLSMAVQQLKKGNKIKQEGFKHVEIVERNIERINNLITELLNCARPAKLNLQPYDIHKVLEDLLESDKTKIDLQKIKVTKNFSSESPVLKIDKEQIERAFLNLITNAIEAMPRGGNLTIITELKGSFFLLKVYDTGKGIPEEDIIKIFDPFFSTKPQGVGLGLSICYGIIVSHGGTIEVESELKKGSIFTISLPR